MPVTPTYPGVYIEELPSGVRTLIGVGTSITAFVGRALRGPVDTPVTIFNYGDFERAFGGLWVDSTLSYAVRQYFFNGGSQAIIVRVANSAVAATIKLLHSGSDYLVLQANSPGAWGNNLSVAVTNSSGSTFTLTVREHDASDNTKIVKEEVFYNLTLSTSSANFVTKVLESSSSLVHVTTLPTGLPANTTVGTDATAANTSGTAGADGSAITDSNVVGSQGSKTGIYALENADLFNLLVLPPLQRGPGGANFDIATSTWSTALAYCKTRRAVLIVDPPYGWDTVSEVTGGIDGLNLRDENSVFYFPNLLVADPLKGNQVDQFAPGGTIAGVIARTDADRGVWKAPAGIDARLVNVQGLTTKLTDGENGLLNPIGVNVLRMLPAAGTVIWGARTLEGADRLASDWKYLPVRRLALFLEESLYRGTQWVVFEPNDESLWAQIRLNLGAFMHQLFRQGAFQGAKPSESYFVKCDSETTTQNDINQGVVNIIVGFAPLKPAEFVIIKLQQMAGQIAV